MSHEHEGEGGVLEMHAEDMGGDDKKNFTAWQRPKAQRRQLIGRILQMSGVHFIFCFRAKEKLDYRSGKPVMRGLMPQAGEEFIYEMTVNFLLPLGANGIPVLTSPMRDEALMIKIPEQFRHLFEEPRQLSADLGQHMAMWAAGSALPAGMDAPKLERAPGTGTSKGPSPEVETVIALYATAPTRDAMKSLRPQYDKAFAAASVEDRKRMKDAGNAAADRIAAMEAAAPVAAELLATTAVVTAALTHAAEPATAAQAATPVQTTPGEPDFIIALYNAVQTREAMKNLRPQFDAVYDTASQADRVRMSAAGNAAANRIAAASMAMPSQPAPSQPAPSRPAAPPTAPAEPPQEAARGLDTIAQRNADGLAAFRQALADLGPEITREQGAQLVIDHMTASAREPRVATEDGLTAQSEIIVKTVPKFASIRSLGVMVRHMEFCAKYPAYKRYADDLNLCTTAENVFECWIVNDKNVDALPDEVKKEARARTGARVEAVDPTITRGGVWLTQRIREAKDVAAKVPVVASVVAPAASVSAASEALVDYVDVSPPGRLNGVPTPPANGSPAPHAPIESEYGQRLALKLNASTVATVADVKADIERSLFQKKIPRGEGETLLSLYSEKIAALAVA